MIPIEYTMSCRCETRGVHIGKQVSNYARGKSSEDRNQVSARRGTILLAHPQALFVAGLIHLLEERGYQLTRQVFTVDELFQAVPVDDPDIVLLHPSLLGDDMSTIRALAKDNSRAIVVLTDLHHASSVPHQAMLAGARGCLSYADAPELFFDSLRLLLLGSTVVSSEASQFLWNLAIKNEPLKPLAELSPREQQLAVLVARGATNREIADELSISEHTVKIHLGHILTKLDLRNRQQLAAWVARLNLVEDIPVED